MSLLFQFPEILREGHSQYEDAIAGNFFVCEEMGEQKEQALGLLAMGENLAFMRYLADKRDLLGKLSLIYIDPPFFSKASYGIEIKLSSERTGPLAPLRQTAYSDRWEDGLEAYLVMLCARLYMMRDLLADDGCLFVHLDWHAVHYVKVLLDEIFGESCFINEIIWNYKSGGTSKRHFSRKHDTLLFYSKTKEYYFKAQQEKSYNRGFKPYRFKGVKEYEDEKGWYTLVNMKDVWQIDMVGRTAGERTGYATQKPEALLSRILASCTKEGDLCADFFGGSGTLAASAQKMNRRWISCDIGGLSVANQQKRLMKEGGHFLLLRQKSEEEDGPLVEMAFSIKENKLSAEILSYMPGLSNKIWKDGKNRDVLEAMAEADPILLLDYWSLDGDFDGEIHRAKAVSFREKERVSSCLMSSMGNFQAVSLQFVDVFGNRHQKTYRFEEIGV